jgi:methionyl-tRNA synthetase
MDETTPTAATIQYDDFAKVDLRVATVVEARELPKSKKLLALQVELANGERRQILAGIKEHYTAEQMVGKQIIVVANLAPREVIKGETSYGMLLAAHDAATGKVIVMGPSEAVSAGSKVS